MINVIPYSELTPELARKGVFVTDMPNEDYHRYEGVSNSGLNLVARSPAHFHYSPPFNSTRAMDIGTAFHTALLEPERYESEYMTVTGCNDRRKAEYTSAAKVYGKDKTLTENEGASVVIMAESIRSNPAARELLDQGGHAEISAFVTDPETGILLRCRFDWLTNDHRAMDLKKTQDAREFAFAKSVNNYRYHCQAAMYRHIYNLITGRELENYQFLAVEEAPPCSNVLYDIDPLAVEIGYKKYREALLDYAIAKESGEWVTYSGVGVVTLPEWALLQDEENTEEEIY